MSFGYIAGSLRPWEGDRSALRVPDKGKPLAYQRMCTIKTICSGTERTRPVRGRLGLELLYITYIQSVQCEIVCYEIVALCRESLAS